MAIEKGTITLTNELFGEKTFESTKISEECPSPTLIEQTFTENGEYLATDYDANGFSSVEVAVPASTLTTKNITANGDYAASADGADGYSSVHVEVQPEVFYATFSGTPYFKKTIIPNTVVDATNDHDLNFSLSGADELEELEVYSNRPNISTAYPFLSRQNYRGTSCPLLKRVYMPYIERITSAFAMLKNKVSPDAGTVEFGSIGHPIRQINQSAFYSMSSSWKGEGWTITVYVNASTLADIPSLISSGQPWGATSATIVYRNSTTGEVITE